MAPKITPNAALIAAAPALLAACQRVAAAEDVLIGILDRKLPGWRSDFLFAEMFSEIRAALASASGPDEARPLAAVYRRWGCSCGPEATVTLRYGPRPAALPQPFPWPPSVVRCQCGGTLNRADLADDEADDDA